MIDLNTLTVFTPQNGIYGGVNKSNFKSIEFWLQAINDNDGEPSTKPNVLGLFGPSSTGKTTTAAVTARALGQPLVSLNCASLDQNSIWESLYASTKSLYPGNRNIHNWVVPYFGCRSEKTYQIKNCVLLLDECHELTTKNQGQLLSILDGSTDTVDNAVQNKKHPLEFSNVTWVFSTTDSGKLLYPLSNRLYSVVLNEYTEQDVVEIVKLKTPILSEESILVLSRAAKLVPRIALELAKQYISIFKPMGYNRKTALSYVNSLRQINEYGLDSTDNKILSMLKESKDPLQKSKRVEKNLLLKKLDQFDAIVNPSEGELAEAIKLQKELEGYLEYENASPHMARSRQDISTYCRLYDMRDLEVRLGYMEKIGVITKTKSGVLWKKDS